MKVFSRPMSPMQLQRPAASEETNKKKSRDLVFLTAGNRSSAPETLPAAICSDVTAAGVAEPTESGRGGGRAANMRFLSQRRGADLPSMLSAVCTDHLRFWPRLTEGGRFPIRWTVSQERLWETTAPAEIRQEHIGCS